MKARTLTTKELAELEDEARIISELLDDDDLDEESVEEAVFELNVVRKEIDRHYKGKKVPMRANKGGAMDKCQSPAFVIDPLLPFIDKSLTIWESASGEGNLVEAFISHKRSIVWSDIENGPDNDFYLFNPASLGAKWDIQVTNPPYGGTHKPRWTERSFQLGKPFALLMPVNFGYTTALFNLWKKYGRTQEIRFNNPARINFKMPNKGWEGQAQFATCWYTYGLNLPDDRMVWNIGKKEFE